MADADDCVYPNHAPATHMYIGLNYPSDYLIIFLLYYQTESKLYFSHILTIITNKKKLSACADDCVCSDDTPAIHMYICLNYQLSDYIFILLSKPVVETAYIY